MQNTSPFKPQRDTVTTIREDGSRRFLYPADAPGRFSVWRRATALALIAIYVLLPWVRVGGPPAVFLDHAFRRIERWLEGDAIRRRALAAAPMTPGKFARRALKHALYLLL